MKTKAAILYEINKPLRIEYIEIPKLGYGQVLVKILASGICRKQIEEIKGHRGKDIHLPHLLGHEATGIVQGIGQGVTKVKPNDYVILSWIKGSGVQSDTPIYYNIDGTKINAGWVTTFQEYSVVSENRVTKINRIRPDIGSLIGCAVSTGFGAAVRIIRDKSNTVAIYGIGGVGLNIIQGAVYRDCSMIIAIDINDKEIISKEFGATHFIQSSETNPIDAIMNLTSGKGVDYSFESAGKKETMEQAYESTSKSGIIVLLGSPPINKKICIDPFDIFHDNKRIVGCLGGFIKPDIDVPTLIDIYNSGGLKLDELITHRCKLDNINDAIDEIEKGNVGRTIVEYDNT